MSTSKAVNGITIEVKGITYEGFTETVVTRSFTNAAGAFSFSAVSTEDNFNDFAIQAGDACVIYVYDEAVLTGYVEKISPSYDATSHRITIQGRDFTCDLIDSTMDGSVIYNSPITLKKIIQDLLRRISLNNINIIENVSLTPFNQILINSAKIGDSYFTFIEQLCRLKQVIFTTDGKGNILLDQASTTRINTVLTSQFGNNANNIVSAAAEYDFMNRFNRYRANTQAAPVGLVGNLGSYTDDEIVNLKGKTAVDNEIRTSRILEFNAEQSATPDELTKRAIWEANLRRAQSKKYYCSVQDFWAEKDNFIWRPNLLVQVYDEVVKINGLLLIIEVTYNFSVENGSTTNLTLVTPDAFTLQVEQDARTASANAFGNSYLA